MAVEGLAIVVDLVGKHSLRARGVEADIEATAASLLRQGSARLLQHCLTEGADCPFFDLESHRYHERRRLPYGAADRSEEHTSELQSLMRISYAVFCLKKKTNTNLSE